ncbi:hypothetical protein AT268_16370 [Bacillus cereus]|uniref:Uncharacterized protein n=1 Tax=Bacillus cereus TaxID=1396 RepID=A0A9X0MDE4_BACCE|nr:hypothetical protein [Bacillus cereus]KXY31113.1 hypothetical protein AT268_16370 [Bacillus cereus]
MDRSIRFGNVTGQNTVTLNTGDDVWQDVKVMQGEQNDSFHQLIEEIKKIQDPDEKQDALDHAQKLQESVASGNKTRAQKIFGWLPEAIQAGKAALDIYSQIEKLSQ